MRIPFLDLRRQLEEIGAEAEGALRRVLRGGAYILGPEVAACEEEWARFCGARFDGALQLVYVERAASATAALGASGRRLAEEGPPKDAANIKSRRYKQGGNHKILNFGGGEGKQ